MRLRPLRDVARPAVLTPTEPPVPTLSRTPLAAVAERDAKGIPTWIALPGVLAEPRVPLFIQAEYGPAWAGMVRPDGAVVDDLKSGSPKRERELSAIKPGTRIVCPTDKRGRILALMAAARLPAPVPSKPKRRSAAQAPARARSADPYEHDVGEVLIAGCGGRVIGVR
jgi:hypothetical protein